METAEECNDELYETAVEEILDEGVTEETSNNENEVLFDATNFASKFSDTCGPSDSTATKHDPSEEQPASEETVEDSFLDSCFGKLPPKSLIKSNLLFAKPTHPKRRPPTKQFSLATNKELPVADEGRDQEANTEALEKDDKYGSVKKRFMRIGGMLVMPVPVPGPLFPKEEI